MKNKGIVYILIAAFTYSIMPVLMRFLDQELPPVTQVFLRYIPALFFALLYAFWKKEKLKIYKKNIIYLLFATIGGYTLMNLTLTLSVLNTEVSNTLFLMSTFVVFTPVLAYFFLKDRLSKVEIVAILISIVGMALLYRPNSFDTWKIGGFFAILSAFFYSIYFVFRQKLSNYSSINLLVLSIISGVFIMGLGSFLIDNEFYASGQVLNLSPTTIIVTIAFGFDNFISWLLLSKGFETIKASTGSLVLLSEPIFGVILGALVFSEIPTIYTVVGSVIILLASGVVILKGKE